MHTEFLMGNAAIAMGAIAAGVNVVAGYPGTPSTEVLETIAKKRHNDVYVEWSINEKAALELTAGAAYTSARTLVTMKQVGLNVASDPLMSLAYIGVKGGMVVMVADDPGPISSQTEQDTRHFAAFSKLPCFDPTSVQEAYEMIQDAFTYSEKWGTPVLFRPTTRICHAYASITIKDENEYYQNKPVGFVKDSRWVIFPRLSFANHQKIEKRNEEISSIFSTYDKNLISFENIPTKKGIASQGISYAYTQETVSLLEKKPRSLKIATPFPFPEKLALKFLSGLDEVLCLEELSPVIERELTYVAGKYNLPVKIRGKLTYDTPIAGENTIDSIKENIYKFLEIEQIKPPILPETPPLPIRPPVLCAGCPHRSSFLAVKEAMKGKKAVFCGDIGCYTLGNAKPLDMVDTCLCMGAGINIAQGIGKIDSDATYFAFVGDSTFFAASITGIINAFYNQANMTVVILDNSTTAMTGHQPHPGTGRTMMGEIVQKVNIEAILKGIGLSVVETINPFDFKTAVAKTREISSKDGVKAIIFKAPCIALFKGKPSLVIDSEKCINCKKCLNVVGCPAISLKNSHPTIDETLCNGCTLCTSICPVDAIKGGNDHE